MAADHAPKPNAFLHPDNPDAVFPQIKKPNIIDLRLHMIKNGGLAASGVFRKHLNKNTKQSPYSIVNQPIEEMQTKAKQMPESESDDEPVAKPQKKIKRGAFRNAFFRSTQRERNAKLFCFSFEFFVRF